MTISLAIWAFILGLGGFTFERGPAKGHIKHSLADGPFNPPPPGGGGGSGGGGGGGW